LAELDTELDGERALIAGVMRVQALRNRNCSGADNLPPAYV
jgi:hypothetical protein